MADQARGHRVGVLQYAYRTRARHRCVALAVRRQRPCWKRPQMQPLFLDPCGSGRVAALNASIEEALVCFARRERARPSQPKTLIDGVLQATVGRLDIAVLVRVAGEVARGSQPVMIDQLSVPFGEVPATALCELVSRRRQIIGAVLDRN